MAAIYIDNHAKEVWSSLFTQSGKVSHRNRVMPCITTTHTPGPGRRWCSRCRAGRRDGEALSNLTGAGAALTATTALADKSDRRDRSPRDPEVNVALHDACRRLNLRDLQREGRRLSCAVEAAPLPCRSG